MHGRSNIRTGRLVAAAVLAILVLAACGTAQRGVGGPPGTQSPAPTIHLGDSDNGKRLTVDVGTRIDVALGSTYWTFRPSSNSAVLSTVGSPSASPSPGCVPGGGCGTMTQAFVVKGAGTAILSAKRTSCGEALLCQPNQRLFEVTLTVH